MQQTRIVVVSRRIVAMDSRPRGLGPQKPERMLQASKWEILERIATGAPLPEILERIVRMVELQADGMVCSILLLDRGQQRLRCGAAPSLPSQFSTAIDGSAIGPNAGSCGTAAFRRERVVVSDISTNPLWADYKELALSHGLLACWSSPILSPEREVLGTFAMYYRQIRDPSPEEFEWVKIGRASCRERV